MTEENPARIASAKEGAVKTAAKAIAIGVSAVGLALTGTTATATAIEGSQIQANVCGAFNEQPALAKESDYGSYSLTLCLSGGSWRWVGWLQRYDTEGNSCTTFQFTKFGSYDRTWKACGTQFTKVDSGVQPGPYSPSAYRIGV
ncbi:hypothetical protein ACIOC2_37030 [Streptomyces sp. NPDC088337]|uniref:hypothetical protein n=1 Tax=unclassified Streptomyces TaxID=2593676 RepID=UPI0038272A39